MTLLPGFSLWNTVKQCSAKATLKRTLLTTQMGTAGTLVEENSTRLYLLVACSGGSLWIDITQNDAQDKGIQIGNQVSYAEFSWHQQGLMATSVWYYFANAELFVTIYEIIANP